jgi:hypothetical protein
VCPSAEIASAGYGQPRKDMKGRVLLRLPGGQPRNDTPRVIAPNKSKCQNVPYALPPRLLRRYAPRKDMKGRILPRLPGGQPRNDTPRAIASPDLSGRGNLRGLLRHYRASRGTGFLHTSKGDHTPLGGDKPRHYIFICLFTLVGAGLVPARFLSL